MRCSSEDYKNKKYENFSSLYLQVLKHLPIGGLRTLNEYNLEDFSTIKPSTPAIVFKGPKNLKIGDLGDVGL